MADNLRAIAQNGQQRGALALFQPGGNGAAGAAVQRQGSLLVEARWLGKFIGFVLGFLMLGPIGALLGFFAGRYFDRGLVQLDRRPPQEHLADAQRVFYETVFRVMGHLAKADGRVSEAEVAQAEALMRQMDLTDEHRAEAIALFKEGSNPAFSLDDAMIRFQSSCGHYLRLRRLLLEYLLHIAFADGELHDAERLTLRAVADWLGMSGPVFERLLQMYQAQFAFSSGSGRRAGASAADHLADAYRALGLDASASDREVKSTYRRLMSQHHPDKLIAQGVPADMLKVATEKSQEISAAYDLIMKSRSTTS